MAHTTCQKKKSWFIVCRWVSVSTENIKDSTHVDMKTILPDDTEKPVRGVQSLTRRYWLCRKVNYGSPRIALYQHVQLVNKVRREQIQVSVWELMKNTGARALIIADVWVPQSGLVCQQVWAHTPFQHGPRECVRYSVWRWEILNLLDSVYPHWWGSKSWHVTEAQILRKGCIVSLVWMKYSHPSK